MTTRLYALAGALLVAVLASLAFACGGGDDSNDTGTPVASMTVSAAEKQAVEDTVTQLAKSTGAGIDYFLAHVTDRVLEGAFGYSREDCRAKAEECVGKPADSVAVTNTTIFGHTATADGKFTSSDGAQEYRLTLVQEAGEWKLDDLAPMLKPVPAGVDAVDLTLSEFKFTFDDSKTRSGNFAFVIKNAGQQAHQVILARIPADADITTLLESPVPPPGVVEIASQGPYSPGSAGTMVFDKPLAAGRYLLVDFLPDTSDPDKVPHAKQGMTAEFTVQ